MEPGVGSRRLPGLPYQWAGRRSQAVVLGVLPGYELADAEIDQGRKAEQMASGLSRPVSFA
jgi:hypothetical protein